MALAQPYVDFTSVGGFSIILDVTRHKDELFNTAVDKVLFDAGYRLHTATNSGLPDGLIQLIFLLKSPPPPPGKKPKKPKKNKKPKKVK